MKKPKIVISTCDYVIDYVQVACELAGYSTKRLVLFNNNTRLCYWVHYWKGCGKVIGPNKQYNVEI